MFLNKCPETMSKTYYNLLFFKQCLDTAIFRQELHIYSLTFPFKKKGAPILKRSNYAYIYKPNFIYLSEL